MDLVGVSENVSASRGSDPDLQALPDQSPDVGTAVVIGPWKRGHTLGGMAHLGAPVPIHRG